MIRPVVAASIAAAARNTQTCCGAYTHRRAINAKRLARREQRRRHGAEVEKREIMETELARGAQRPRNTR